MITPETYQALGLSDDEYTRILEILDREPTPTELAMFSVEWSEHCGYMCSRPLLSKLPKTGNYQTTVGEDSGAVIVDDLAIVFKMESHNHPSQIEPLQGAATGVGGILRDIFTAGARPIASLNSLRFGPLSDPYNKHLLREVVRGIGWYGNCVGVPTVGGEIYFDESYSGNCLVNAMTIGICDKKKIASAKAVGHGNVIMYVGNTTGRDGIGGCSVLASNEFGEGEANRPTVQVGDPYTEKCLIEATLETLDTGHVLGIKDMGAAGLTCSITEMAAAGGVGMDIILDLVPLRETGMEAYEIMMSESQERMLVCVEKGKEERVKRIFDKWGLHAAAIGTTTEDTHVVISYKGDIVANVDATILTDPDTYDLPATPIEQIVSNVNIHDIPESASYNSALLALLASPTIASKRWVYEQYDHMVQTNTVTLPGKSDAAVIRLKGTNKAIAATVDCNSTYCKLDPKNGSGLAIIESAQNLICTGAKPIAVTDCLNFGNPMKPEVFWQFKKSIEGIAETCKMLNLPVVSGNVSFYNESPTGPINPTPTIGMVGIIDNIDHVMTQDFKREGDAIVLISSRVSHRGPSSEYFRTIHGVEDTSAAIKFNALVHSNLQEAMLLLIKNSYISSAHDCSEGGLLVALSESCLSGTIFGASIELRGEHPRRDMDLFHEAPHRVVVSCRLHNVEDVIDTCHRQSLKAMLIGCVSDSKLTVRINENKIVDLSIDDVNRAWSTGLEKQL